MHDVRTFLIESKDHVQINSFMECIKTFKSRVVCVRYMEEVRTWLSFAKKDLLTLRFSVSWTAEISTSQLNLFGERFLAILPFALCASPPFSSRSLGLQWTGVCSPFPNLFPVGGAICRCAEILYGKAFWFFSAYHFFSIFFAFLGLVLLTSVILGSGICGLDMCPPSWPIASSPPRFLPPLWEPSCPATVILNVITTFLNTW